MNRRKENRMDHTQALAMLRRTMAASPAIPTLESTRPPSPLQISQVMGRVKVLSAEELTAMNEQRKKADVELRRRVCTAKLAQKIGRRYSRDRIGLDRYEVYSTDQG